VHGAHTKAVQPVGTPRAGGRMGDDEFNGCVEEQAGELDGAGDGAENPGHAAWKLGKSKHAESNQQGYLLARAQGAALTGTVYPVSVPHLSPPKHHNWIYRRSVLPILALLRMGATPRVLAWSIAAGLLIGINPVIGSTTLLCLAVALPLRLNVAASQIANHAAFPLELALVVPFIRLGSRAFHTQAMPLSPGAFFAAARTAPLALTRQLWLWEWHAFVLWAGIAVVAVPAIAAALTPVLRRFLARIERHEYPIIPTLQ